MTDTITLIFSNATTGQTTQDQTYNYAVTIPVDLNSNSVMTLTNAELGNIPGVPASATITITYINGEMVVELDSAWNSVKNIDLESSTNLDVTLKNFVHTDVTLGGTNPSEITLEDAKRGTLTSGSGDDVISINAYSNGGWSNDFVINTGDGDDIVDVDVANNGQTVIELDAGNGDDTVTITGDSDDKIIGGSGNDTIYSGDGNDTIIFSGNAEDYTLTALGGGIVAVTDNNLSDGDDGTDIIYDAETLSFANYDVSVDTLTIVQDPLVVSSEITVNETLTGAQGEASVAVLSNGSHVVVWHGPNGSDGQDVFGRVFNADGTAGSEFRINSYVSNDQKQADVVALSGGGFVVSWQSYLEDGSSYGTFAQRYDASGVVAGGQIQLNTTTASEQSWASLAALSNGGFVATWQSFGSDWNVTGQRFDAAGAKVGSEFDLSQTTASDTLPVVEGTPDGGFIAVWNSSGHTGGSGVDVYGRRYDQNGSAIGNEFLINTTTTGTQDRPVIAVQSDGSFLVAWQSNSQENGYGIYAQIYNASGATVGNELHVNSYTNSDQGYPDAIALSDGSYLVAWHSGGNQDGSYYGLYGQRLASNGTALGNEFLINETTDYYQIDVALAARSDGGFVAAWEDSLINGGSEYDIKSRVFAADAITYTGTSSSDVFSVDRWDGSVLVDNYDSASSPVTDTLNFGAGITQDDLWFAKNGNDLNISVVGTLDHVRIEDWYIGSANQHLEIEAGGASLGVTGIGNLVNAMASFTPPALGEMIDTVDPGDTLDPIIAANWQ